METLTQETEQTTPDLEAEAAKAEGRLVELQGQLQAVRERITSGQATEDDHLIITDLNRRVQAAGAVRDAAATKFHQARNAARQAKRNAEVAARMERVGNLVPQLLWELAKITRVEDRGAPYGPEFGIPHGWAKRVAEAIVSADAEWHYDFLDGNRNPPPHPKNRQRRHVTMHPSLVDTSTGKILRGPGVEVEI